MLQLTSKERDIFEFIKDFQEKHNYPPLFKQIAEAKGVSTGTVQWYVNSLERKGRLTKVPNEARTIKLIGD